MNVTKHFPREFKYTIGEKIQNAAVEMLVEIYRANSAISKSDSIKKILEYVQLIGLYLRISFDMKIVTEAKYAHFVEELGSVSKQVNGWLASLEVK